MSILSLETISGEQIPPEDAVNMYNPLHVQIRLWTVTQRRETHSSHSFAIWGLLGFYTAPYFPLNYQTHMPYTVHSKKITMRNCGKQGKSTGSDWGNPHYKLVGRVSNLCSLDSTSICLGEQPHIQTELLEVAEQPWNWKYLKISLYFLFLHLSKNLAYFSLSLAETESAYFRLQNSLSPSFNHQLTLGCHKFPYQSPWLIYGKEQMSKSVSIMADSSLCYLPVWQMQPFLVLESPALEGRAWYWPSCPPTSAYWKCTSIAAAARK